MEGDCPNAHKEEEIDKVLEATEEALLVVKKLLNRAVLKDI